MVISHLYVLSDFKPPSTHRKRIEAVGVLGIVAGALFVGLLFLGILLKMGYLGGKVSADKGTNFLSILSKNTIGYLT